MKTGQKHSKILKSQEADRPWTDRTEQYSSKQESIKEINKEGFMDCREINRKMSQQLDDLQNFLIKLTVKASAGKVWLLHEFPLSLNLSETPNDEQTWKSYSSLQPVSREDHSQKNSKKNWWDILEAE